MMSRVAASLRDGRVLEIITDRIEVTSLSPRPDRRWEYADQAGHRHVWSDGWPTLRYVIDEPAYTAEEDGIVEECPETGHHRRRARCLTAHTDSGKVRAI